MLVGLPSIAYRSQLATKKTTEARVEVSVKRAEALEAELKRCRQAASAAGGGGGRLRPGWAPPLTQGAAGGGDGDGSCECDYTVALELGRKADGSGGPTRIILHPLDVMPFAHELVEAPCGRQPELFPAGFEYA